MIPAAAGRSPGVRDWTHRDRLILAAGLGLSALLHLVLLPAPGFRGDLDQFVRWVHGLATGSLGEVYRMDLSFPPVMVYVFGALAALEPRFREVSTGGDPWISALMKLPASIADFAIAGCLVVALRDRPRAAVAAALGIALHPAVLYISAWWGQYESLYLLPAVVAVLLLRGGRPVPAAVAIVLSVMTKPQALPLLIPFAAWYLARYRWRTWLASAVAGFGTLFLLWLPFLADGGPTRYLDNVARYQGEVFSVLSLRAWNFWWLVQELLGGGGDFLSDLDRLVGPLSARQVGFVLAGGGLALVFVAALRRATDRGLALSLSAAALVAFSFLTTMHERYAFAALIFLPLLIDDRRVRLTWLVFGGVFTLNVFAAIPATPAMAALLPVDGPLGILGSCAMLGCTAAACLLLQREAQRPFGSPSSAATAETGG